jgi:DNA-directed RNA polymerase alpha subunit
MSPCTKDKTIEEAIVHLEEAKRLLASLLPEKSLPLLKSFRWSNRMKNIFDRAGITTTEQLMAKDMDEMARYKGFGRTMVSEMRAQLATASLKLEEYDLPKWRRPLLSENKRTDRI